MRTTVTLLLVLVAATTQCQKIEKCFDFNWRPCEPKDASYFGVINFTDSGWHRQDFFAHGEDIQMDGTYEDSACKIPNGLFYYFYPGKKLERYGRYVHGKQQGLWLVFYPNGMVSDSSVYDAGNRVGTSLAWYASGAQKDSMTWAANGDGVEVYWYEDGTPSAAGRFKNGKLYGKWQYFHPNGKLSSLELYDDGKLQSIQYFDENGTPVDTAGRNHEAAFAGGPAGWQKYLLKHLYFPDGYKIVNSDVATAVVSFAVDETGKVVDAYVSTPLSRDFDKIALDVVNRSPLWQPAVQHNHKVRYYMRQSVNFSQAQQ